MLIIKLISYKTKSNFPKNRRDNKPMLAGSAFNQLRVLRKVKHIPATSFSYCSINQTLDLLLSYSVYVQNNAIQTCKVYLHDLNYVLTVYVALAL